MHSQNKYKYSPVPPADTLEEEKIPQERASPPLGALLPEEKNIDVLIKALVRGNTKKYSEKVALAFHSSFLSLPLLFGNAGLIFFESQAKLNSSQRKNPYSKFYFDKFIPVFSTEGAIINAEAAGITTTTVLLTILITVLSLGYQGTRYWLNKKEMDKLVNLLNENHYVNAAALRPYSLSRRQFEEIRRLIRTDDLDENTVIEASITRCENFIADMLWFHEQTDKYISPLLLLSLCLGFEYMYLAAQELDPDMNCSMFSLWALIANVCPIIQRVELMSLLTYMWGFLSSTFLASRSLAIVTRVAMIPFPNIRRWFHEKINSPFSNWWGDNEHYNQLIEKTLLFTALPLFVPYSLNAAVKFTNAYLGETGCRNIGQALKRLISSDKPYPCSMTQAALGASVLVGKFEFLHVYPAYMAIRFFTTLSAFIVKRVSYFQQERVIEKVKSLLSQFTSVENKLKLAIAAGVIVSGAAAFLPSVSIANTILQKEGFELFYPLNNLTSLAPNLTIPLSPMTIPDSLPESSLPFDDIINSLPACTIGTAFGIPDLILGNMTVPGFETTVPCVEVFYDENKNLIIGLQVTPTCPNENIYSLYYRNLLHLPIACDPILSVRSFAGFLVPYWLSVNTGAAVSLSFAATLLLGEWTIKKIKASVPSPAVSSAQEGSDENKSSYSPRLFSSSRERDSIELQPLEQDLTVVLEDPEEELDNEANDDEYPDQQASNYFSRLKSRIWGLFHKPQPAERKGGCQQPLINPPKPAPSLV